MFKKGNEIAFQRLYEQFSPGLFNYLVRLVGDWHYAEDILLETFTKLAKSNLEERGSLKAWLYRVATNQSYKFFRKIDKTAPLFEEGLKKYTGNPLKSIEKEIKIQKLLRALPEQQKAVLVLKFFENMGYQEIANILCCPLGTVKSRMHEGLKNLKRRKDELH